LGNRSRSVPAISSQDLATKSFGPVQAARFILTAFQSKCTRAWRGCHAARTNFVRFHPAALRTAGAAELWPDRAAISGCRSGGESPEIVAICAVAKLASPIPWPNPCRNRPRRTLCTLARRALDPHDGDRNTDFGAAVGRRDSLER
jgi:hypothetical protein